ncbi:MAG: sulfotransferase domain-containing protein [Caldilineaceae bacterium]|nr:sulfotransferase domain-containing protein [Caldilineaceae bacterium]
MFNGDLQKFVAENKIDFLSYDNADYAYVSQLDHYQGFHVVRDPRDICVSAYFSHLHSHGTKRAYWAEQRAALQSMSKTDGLLYEMKCRKQQFTEMYTWNYQQSNVLELRMEEVTQNPYKHLVQILSFLDLVDTSSSSVKKRFQYCLYSGLRRLEVRSNGYLALPAAPSRLPVERLLGIVWENDFAKKARKRNPGEENIRSHYRKGIAGDWKNHFEAVHLDYFHRHYSALLLKLAYEWDPDWWQLCDVQQTDQERVLAALGLP